MLGFEILKFHAKRRGCDRIHLREQTKRRGFKFKILRRSGTQNFAASYAASRLEF